MKIIITEQQLNELFSQSLVEKLIEKFKKEKPDLDEKIIQYYIKRFQELKNSPKVKEKDINKYSWKDLEILIDENQPRDYDKSIKISDSDLIYKKDSLRVYKANTKQACVTYGNGYSFCISARSEYNMYNSYRFDSNYSIYFVFDDERPRDILPNGKFKDPLHLLVIMVRYDLEDITGFDEYNHPQDAPTPQLEYQITTANNDGEKETKYFRTIENMQPKLTNRSYLFIPMYPEPYEIKEYELEKEVRKKLQHHALAYTVRTEDESKFGLVYDVNDYNKINQMLSGKKPIIYDGYNNANKIMVSQSRMDNMDENKWIKMMNDETDSHDENDEYYLTTVKTRELNFRPEFIQYLAKASDIISEYLNKKNKLRAQYS